MHDVCLDDIDRKLDHILRHVHAQGRILADVARYLTDGGMTPVDVQAVTDNLKSQAEKLAGISASEAPPAAR